MADSQRELQVQVCYAEPASQILLPLSVPAGTTVKEAISQSGLDQRLAPEELAACKVGIYGKLKTLDTVLRDRDRVEIYRPLQADPKEARRRRAEKKRRTKA